MISIKDYAAQKNVSYEAIRKQIKRYENQLNGHLERIGRTLYLDDDAIAFLDEKRKKNPVVVVKEDTERVVQGLYNENKQLLIKITALQEDLIEEKSKVQELQGLLLAEKEQVKQLQAQIIDAATDDDQEDDPEQTEDIQPTKTTLWSKIKSWF
nr:unnamed protein product [uncultured bacterium]